MECKQTKTKSPVGGEQIEKKNFDALTAIAEREVQTVIKKRQGAKLLYKGVSVYDNHNPYTIQNKRTLFAYIYELSDESKYLIVEIYPVLKIWRPESEFSPVEKHQEVRVTETISMSLNCFREGNGECRGMIGKCPMCGFIACYRHAMEPQENLPHEQQTIGKCPNPNCGNHRRDVFVVNLPLSLYHRIPGAKLSPYW